MAAVNQPTLALCGYALVSPYLVLPCYPQSFHLAVLHSALHYPACPTLHCNDQYAHQQCTRVVCLLQHVDLLVTVVTFVSNL